MLLNERSKLASFVVDTASELDIPDDVYKDAVLKYEDISTWLLSDDSALRRYAPDIYTQGSFRLGTVVRPLTEADEYDIDLVCKLDLEKSETSQEKLKEMTGDRLKAREDLKSILTPSRWCWTVNYEEDLGALKFRIDILPVIPNVERKPHGILLGDSALRPWQKSSPVAYSEWFYSRMFRVFHEKRAALAESLQASIEDVPEWSVKTPLQRAIQILKRHRDIFFQKKRDLRPASILITTLAAKAYKNQEDVFDALVDIANQMPLGVRKKNNVWWVENPVDSDENFADKWKESDDLREAFVGWAAAVNKDFTDAAKMETLDEAIESLAPVLGEQTMTKVAGKSGVTRNAKTVASRRWIPPVPPLGSSSHLAAPPWPVIQNFTAAVTASVHFKRGSRRLWLLEGKPVKKGLWLRFGVKTNCPEPYEVKWQVINTGSEATGARQLRGGFEDSSRDEASVRWEQTAFRGTHWVEAFIVRNGSCVARSGRTLVKIK